MSKRKEIMAQMVVAIIALPAVMIFNDNAATVEYNIIGFAYALVMTKAYRYILPGWIVDYIQKI